MPGARLLVLDDIIVQHKVCIWLTYIVTGSQVATMQG